MTSDNFFSAIEYLDAKIFWIKIKISGKKLAHPSEAEDSLEKEECETQPCPKWSSWSKWSSCDKHCGKGYQKSNKICMHGYPDLPGCRGPSEKRKNCFNQCDKGGICFKGEKNSK